MTVQAQLATSETEHRSRKRRKKTRFSSLQQVLASDFLALESSHPYGVLPGGNRFLNESSGAARHISPNDLVSDECWNDILSFCAGVDLGRVVQSCRFFYVVGHQPELWRDLVLRRQGNSTISTSSSNWKDTYVKLFYDSDGKYRPHEPTQVGNTFSDYYYRLHECRSFAIPSPWLMVDSGTVDRVPVENMTTERFFREYETPNRPVVIERAASSWKAFERWQDPAYCEKHTSGRSFRATSGAAALSANFSLPAYHNYCRSPHLEEAPLYLFDRTALKPGSDLWLDYMPDLQQACPYWNPDRGSETGHDLFQLLGEGRRPDHTWLILGPQRSGSVFHIDPNATHAWNAAIKGRKRWIFYPPGVAPPGVHPSQDGDEVALPLSVGEWIFQFWDEHLERMISAPPEERPLECTAFPGDVLFVPHGWWHMVVNLDETNIAITHNYVSPSNLGSVLRFLDTKRDQVSGCRDRPESIKPEQLYEEFVSALESHHPKWLQKALEEPDWTCNAWSSPRNDESAGASSTIGAEEKISLVENSSVMAKAKQNEDGGFSFSFIPSRIDDSTLE